MNCPECGSDIMLIFTEISRSSYTFTLKDKYNKQYNFTKVPHESATSEIGIHYICSKDKNHNILSLHAELLDARSSFVNVGPWSHQ